MHFAALSRQHWPLFLSLILVGLIQSGCFLTLVYLARRFVEAESYVITLEQGLVVMGMIAILAFGRFHERYIAEKFAQNHVRKLREQIFEFSLRLPASDRDMLNRGSTLLRLTNDMSAIRTWVVQGLAPLTVLSVWLLAAISGLIQIHWTLGFALLPCLLLIITGNYLIGSSLYKSSEKARRSRGRLIRNTAEKLRHFHLIKTFNQQGREKRQFYKKSRKTLRHQLNKAKMQAILRGFNEAVLLGTIFVLFITALQLEAKELVSAQSIAVLLTAGLYLLSQMRRLSRLYELWTLQRVALDKLAVFFSRPREVDDGRRSLPAAPLKIKLRKLSVRNRFPPLNATLEQSSRVVLSGTEGSGKSTLLKTLAGLQPHDGGKLIFNGRDSIHFHPSLWSRTVTLISSELPLFQGTVRENLFYGARHQEQSYTRSILTLTKIPEESLDTGKITEAGSNLSDGEKLRLKLARALLRRPKLLLIDTEPALRDESAIKLLKSLFEDFDGAIIIAADIPELSDLITSRWNLDSGAVEHVSSSTTTPNILPFKSNTVRGEA